MNKSDSKNFIRGQIGEISMKPLAIALVCMALVLGFSSVNAGLGQSNPQACEVHERAVAELKKQAWAISNQLAYDSGDEDNARTALSDFTKALSNPRLRQSVLEKYLGSTLGEQIEALKALGLKAEYPTNKLLLRAVRDAQIRKVQRITYARSHHAELKQQQANIGKQLIYHYNRLAELGCKDAQEEPKSGCDGFAGTWKTSFGEMTFTITDNTATASYDFDGGTVRGMLSDGGRVLSGNYREKEAEGTFQFVLAEDGQSFSGRWKKTSGRREPPSGTWEGKCIQP